MVAPVSEELEVVAPVSMAPGSEELVSEELEVVAPVSEELEVVAPVSDELVVVAEAAVVTYTDIFAMTGAVEVYVPSMAASLLEVTLRRSL